MGGIGLGQGSPFQDLLGGETILGYYFRYLKNPFGEGARFIKNHGVQVGQGIKEVGPLHQDTAAGSPSNTAKVTQGNGNN